MRKIFVFSLICLLTLSMNVQAFAATSSDEKVSEPFIGSANHDYIIDTTEVVNFLNTIKDAEKRKLLEQYFFVPVTVTTSEQNLSTTQNSDMTMKVPAKAKELAKLSIKDLKADYSKSMKQKVKEISSNVNVSATPAMKNYIQENQPELLSLVADKVVDSSYEEVISLTDSELNAIEPKSIVVKNYTKDLAWDSMLGTVLRAQCNVDWNYDSATKKITSLYPETTFWHSGFSPVMHIISPQWYKNEQFIKSRSSGDRAFVQKSKDIMEQTIQGGDLFAVSRFVFNLVFSPSATNSSKTLLNDTGCPPAQLGDTTIGAADIN